MFVYIKYSLHIHVRLKTLLNSIAVIIDFLNVFELLFILTNNHFYKQSTLFFVVSSSRRVSTVWCGLLWSLNVPVVCFDSGSRVWFVFETPLFYLLFSNNCSAAKWNMRPVLFIAKWCLSIQLSKVLNSVLIPRT